MNENSEDFRKLYCLADEIFEIDEQISGLYSRKKELKKAYNDAKKVLREKARG